MPTEMGVGQEAHTTAGREASATNVLADELIDNLAIGVDERESQGHLPKAWVEATEAGIEGANHGLDTVESAG